MKDFLKTDIFLKIAIITGLAVLLIILFTSTKEKDSPKDTYTQTETKLISMISLLCKDDSPKVMIKTDKDGITVIGVGIVTESADNPVVKEKILELTSKILDVSPARICITI